MVKPRGNGRTKQGPAARAALPSGYSATHGLPAALERALGDYQQRQPCPPVVCDGAAAAAAAQASPSVTKSLNVAPGYAPHFQSGIRELIQNWQDQCQVVAGYGAMHVADLTQPSAVAAGSLLLAACCGARCCGYLALAAPGGGGVGAGVCDVFLCNYASTIAMSAMTLGESSKRDNATLAGCFGEVRAWRSRQASAAEVPPRRTGCGRLAGLGVCPSTSHLPSCALPGSQGGDQQDCGIGGLCDLPHFQSGVELPLRRGAGGAGAPRRRGCPS